MRTSEMELSNALPLWAFNRLPLRLGSCIQRKGRSVTSCTVLTTHSITYRHPCAPVDVDVDVVHAGLTWAFTSSGSARPGVLSTRAVVLETIFRFSPINFIFYPDSSNYGRYAGISEPLSADQDFQPLRSSSSRAFGGGIAGIINLWFLTYLRCRFLDESRHQVGAELRRPRRLIPKALRCP